MTTVSAASAPHGAAITGDLAIVAGGVDVPVYRCQALDYAMLVADGPVEITVTAGAPLGAVTVRPQHRGAATTVDGATLTLAVDRPRQLYVELAGRPPLALFIDPPDARAPDPADPDVRFFGPGVHHPGEIALRSGQTLYLAAGAVVHGHVRASGVERVSVRGTGILDGTHLPRGHCRLMVFEGCRDVLVEGITTVGTPSWNLVFGACERVRVSRVKLIGWVVTSDGIDVVGSRDVLIEDCFLRNNDDCVAVKSIDSRSYPRDARLDWRGDVTGVRVRRCVCYNDHAGNALEIGFETRCGSISGIVFEDCDIIGAHGEGGVFTIHNGDRAVISDVLYRDIRVEHFYDRFIDFRVMRSRYSKDDARGVIRDITLRDIQTIEDRYNTPSLIGGWDAASPVRDVVFERLRMGDRHVLGPDDLHLFVKHAEGVVFR